METNIKSGLNNEHLQNFAAGWGAGITADMIIAPFQRLKVDEQRGHASPKTIRGLWAGVFAIALGDGFAIGLQNTIYEIGKTQFSQENGRMLCPANLASVGAGIISSVPTTISEITMDQHGQKVRASQEAKKTPGGSLSRVTYWSTIGDIYGQSGWRGFLRGYKCTAVRETIYAQAWKRWASQFTDRFEAYTQNHQAAQIGGGICAGVLAAFLSHPFDTAKVKEQNKLRTGFIHAKFYSTIKEDISIAARQTGSLKVAICKTGLACIQDAYKGFRQRAVMVSLAVTILNITTPWYTNKIKQVA